MKKIKVALYMEDREFINRFSNCLMQYYGKDLRLHIYEEIESLLENGVQSVDCVILEGRLETFWEKEIILSEDKREKWLKKVIWLRDREETVENSMEFIDNPQVNVQIVDKFANINQIYEYIRAICPVEVEITLGNHNKENITRLIGVYSMSETGLQLPFAITLGLAISQKEKVLLLDLQENSGISEYCDEWEMGLEEMIVMIGESGKTFGGLNQCIGHIDRMDFIYPARNCESLCQIEASHYQKVLEVLQQELSYDVIIFNFGGRFQGFCQILSSCGKIYFLESKYQKCSWRKREFLEELERKDLKKTNNQVISVELPQAIGDALSCRRQVEEWQWGSFGDEIRSLCQKVVCYG